MSSSDLDTARTLAREGWEHLRLQRPQAAWASWRRALGYAPDQANTRQALDRLEQSPQLPAAARSPLKFRPPGDPDRRRRWDSRFRDRDLEDLDDAADVFAALAGEDAEDGAAWYNHAVCLAWLGRNADAVQALERVVALQAGAEFGQAVGAWTLAEVLRQGAGAEALADDLAYAWMIDCDDADADDALAHWAGLVAVPPPLDPDTGAPQFGDASAYTWLDRPLPEPTAALAVADLPRVLAQVLRLPGGFRISSPDPVTLDRVIANLMTSFGGRLRPTRRDATPLPLVLLDADVWSFRLPPGLEPEAGQALSREAVERYYENHWIHLPRHGLGGRSPRDASRLALEGDAVARAKLTAVVRFREQLGRREWASNLYHGYPFDRLRRRLGLAPDDPSAVEPGDLSCMSADELARLDPSALDDVALAEGYELAAALRDDALAARFAAALVRRDSPALARLDATAVVATLVREALRANAPDDALDWLDRARALNGGRDRRLFEVWAAELHARTGAPAAALLTYQQLLTEDPAGTALALDGAETLLDHGYFGHARPLLLYALDQSRLGGDRQSAERAEALLEQGAAGAFGPPDGG